MTLSIKATIDSSSLPTEISGNMPSLILGSTCERVRFGNKIWRVDSSSLSETSGLGSIQGSSSDLVYAISGNALFKYASTSNSYSSLQTLNSHTNYKVKNYVNEIVAWGSSSSGAGAGSYQVNQTVYAMYDNNGLINTISTWPITAHDNVETEVPVQISPFFSKINFEYYASSGNNTKSIFFYSVDYEANTVSTISLQNLEVYLQTVAKVSTYSKNNYNLGDYYLAIRN